MALAHLILLLAKDKTRSFRAGTHKDGGSLDCLQTGSLAEPAKKKLTSKDDDAVLEQIAKKMHSAVTAAN
jgi:hypothetical protein